MDRTVGAAKLEAEIGQERGAKATAARELGISEPVLLDWITGRKRPKQHNREAVKIWSHGRIAPDDWATKEERKRLLGIRPRPEDESDGPPSERRLQTPPPDGEKAAG